MLYIMRHGQTDWNRIHKLQGRTNIPLNEFGRQSSIEAGQQYKDTHLDVCYCSPLDRAQETARLFIGSRDIPIITDERLAEMCFGIYEGEQEVFEKPECPVREFFFNPGGYEATGGAESIEELFERTGEFLNEVAYTIKFPENFGKYKTEYGADAFSYTVRYVFDEFAVELVQNFPTHSYKVKEIHCYIYCSTQE